MKTFLGISLPSQALQAMIDGLLEADKRPDFAVNMTTFGMVGRSGACHGCAATCTLQKLAGVQFSRDVIGRGDDRAVAVGLPFAEVAAFETAVDFARKGMLMHIFDFFKIKYPEYGQRQPLWNVPEFVLTTDLWRDNLPDYQRLADELKAAGY
jgi:hypothetical protein